MNKKAQKVQVGRETIRAKSLGAILDTNRRLNNKFVYAQCDFTNVLRSLVSEVEKLKNNSKVSIEFVNTKEDQIDRLINFNNVVEQILEEFKQHLTALKLSNEIIERTFLESKDIDQLILKNKVLREEFLNV